MLLVHEFFHFNILHSQLTKARIISFEDRPQVDEEVVIYISTYSTNFKTLKMDTVNFRKRIDIGYIVAVDNQVAEEWEITFT